MTYPHRQNYPQAPSSAYPPVPNLAYAQQQQLLHHHQQFQQQRGGGGYDSGGFHAYRGQQAPTQAPRQSPQGHSYYPHQHQQQQQGYEYQQQQQYDFPQQEQFHQQHSFYQQHHHVQYQQQQYHRQQHQPQYIQNQTSGNFGARGGGYHRGGGFPRGGGTSRGGGYRGGGGGGGGGPRDLLFYVTVKDFAAVDRASSEGLLAVISEAARGKILRGTQNGEADCSAVVVVEQRFIGAIFSFTRVAVEATVVPEDLSRRFLDISACVNDQGWPLAETADGSLLPKHLFAAIRPNVVSVARMAKSDNSALKESLLEMRFVDVLRELTLSVCALDAAKEVIASDVAPDTSAEEFLTKLLESIPVLLTTPQGTELVSYLWRVRPQDKRKFFDSLQAELDSLSNNSATQDKDGTSAAAAGDDLQIQECRPYQRFKSLFCGLMAAPMVIEIFCSSSSSSSPPLQNKNFNEEDMKAIAESVRRVACTFLTRFGYELACEMSGGGAMLSALLRRCYSEKASSAADYDGAPKGPAVGSKRPREDGNSDASPASVPTSSVKEDWSLLYAVAAAFTHSDESKTLARIMGMCRHASACRAAQAAVPLFLDCIAAGEADKEDPVLAAAQTVAHRFIAAAVADADVLICDHYGNYVMQTLIVSLTRSCASSGHQSVRPLLQSLVKLVADHCVEFSSNKCGSNCVEKLLEASLDPHVAITIAEGFFRRGNEAVIATATHSFGNYVVRHLAQRLTSLVTAPSANDGAGEPSANKAANDEMNKVAECERRLFCILSAVPRQSGPYAQGIVAWVSSQGQRLRGSQE